MRLLTNEIITGAQYSKLLADPDHETKFGSLYVMTVSSRKQVTFQM